MESRRNNGPASHENTELKTSSQVVAALFDDRKQADVALGDLERTGVPRNKIGFLSPANATNMERRWVAENPGRKDRLIPGLATTGFPGWTMGMAPWAITGVGPLIVGGSLSLVQQKDRPKDLRELTSSLGLSADAAQKISEGFRRRAILVTVEAHEKETIIMHVLERNGGHALLRKQ